MTEENISISKSEGVTPTERLLAHLSERAFHKLWSYANPYKDDGKELCDLIVAFEDRVYIFFDRESRKFDSTTKDNLVTWSRWKRSAIDNQIRTAKGAERYIKSDRPIFLDSAGSQPFPIKIHSNSRISKFIVAHGAMEACKAFSDDNVYGSLAISYGQSSHQVHWPFLVELDKNHKIHVLDSHNLGIVFSSLDTIYDFSSYIEEKERCIEKFNWLAYCGEEDLLAHYLSNFQTAEGRYRIGSDLDSFDSLIIGEGEWSEFVRSERYKNRIAANRPSYLWDELIQKTCQNALDGTIGGNANLLKGKSAIHEMAKEPRLTRRTICERMKRAINNFPDSEEALTRHVSFISSFYEDVGYVFLQVRSQRKLRYEEEYHPLRQNMIEIACGAARNKLPHLNKIIGIAIDAPKHAQFFSEDFLLLDCSKWSEEDAAYYRRANEQFNFFETDMLKMERTRSFDFPI